MANRCDYITLSDFRSTYQGSATAATGNDTLIAECIKSVARDIEQGSRWFYPRIETRYYNAVGSRQLDFDPWDVLELTTLTNGDGTVIASTNYDLLPYYGPPYYAVRLTLPSGLVYQVGSTGSVERAIALTGVGGFHKDYGSAWETQVSVTGVLAAGTTALSGLTSGELQAGQLVKLGTGNDYAYVSVASGTTATLIRGVNGSTAVAHGATDAIAVWNAGDDLTLLAKQAVQAYLRLKDNPQGDRVVMPGIGTFSTPKDVTRWVNDQMTAKGYVQLY